MAVFIVEVSPTEPGVAVTAAPSIQLEVQPFRGPRGRGWTGGSYDAGTGVVTFSSNDGIGFSTDDIRGDQANPAVIGSVTPNTAFFSQINISDDPLAESPLEILPNDYLSLGIPARAPGAIIRNGEAGGGTIHIGNVTNGGTMGDVALWGDVALGADTGDGYLSVEHDTTGSQFIITTVDESLGPISKSDPLDNGIIIGRAGDLNPNFGYMNFASYGGFNFSARQDNPVHFEIKDSRAVGTNTRLVMGVGSSSNAVATWQNAGVIEARNDITGVGDLALGASGNGVFTIYTGNGRAERLTIDNAGAFVFTGRGEVQGPVLEVGTSSSGPAALTANDGGGNASVTFNHTSTLPQAGTGAGSNSAARIAASVDSPIGLLDFKVFDDVTAGVTPPDNPVVRMYSDRVQIVKDVGMGIDPPLYKLDVRDSGGIVARISNGDSGGTPSTTHAEFIVESDDTNLGIQFLGTDTSNQRIMFGDTGSAGSGQIQYDHANNYMAFRANGNEAFRVNSGGDMGIGINPQRRLHIADAGSASMMMEDTSGPNAEVGTQGSGHFVVDIDVDSDLAAGAAHFVVRNQTSTWLWANGTGLGVFTAMPSCGLDVDDDRLRIRQTHTPASATDTGSPGMIAWDSSYLYVAVGTDQWKRAALATW